MASVLYLSSTSLGLLSPSGAQAQQPCFARRQNGAWVFDDIQNCQFHTDALDQALNTYFLDCAQKRRIRQDGWEGCPIDLVYEQLSALLRNATEGLILVLSSVYSKPQIEYITGVLNEITTTTAVVLAPLAYSYAMAPGAYTVLEVEMRDTVATKIDIDNGVVSVKESKVIPNFGLQHIYSEQYSVIQDEFIKRHRYDPNHTAANKAILLDQLSAAWRADATAEVYLEVQEYGIHVPREKLQVALPERLRELIDNGDCRLVPSPMVPIDQILSEIPTLPQLELKHVAALSDTDSLQYVDTANVAEADTVRYFHTIEHRQVA